MVLRLRNVGEIRGYTGLKVECFEEIKGRNREGTCKCRIWSMLKIWESWYSKYTILLVWVELFFLISLVSNSTVCSWQCFTSAVKMYLLCVSLSTTGSATTGTQNIFQMESKTWEKGLQGMGVEVWKIRNGRWEARDKRRRRRKRERWGRKKEKLGRKPGKGSEKGQRVKHCLVTKMGARKEKKVAPPLLSWACKDPVPFPDSHPVLSPATSGFYP